MISMNYSQTISKIRERGQLTVPQYIRQALNWPEDEVIVKITTINDGFRVERLPISHPQHAKKKLTEGKWNEIWRAFDKIRKSGRQDIDLRDFIRKDRDTRG